MEKDKDSHVIVISDANVCSTTCDPSTSSEISDQNDLADLSPSSTSERVLDETVVALEGVEVESVSNANQSTDSHSTNYQDASSYSSLPSLNSIVCRICHNAENPERLVSPCNCRGTLEYVHVYCLERWISTSRCTTCELCHFEYHTEQTLRYSCFQSLRIYYSRHISRRTLQEDCQMFSMLTLVAFGIVGTLLVGLQYYLLQGNIWGIGKIWTKGWLLFFLFTTLAVYIVNIYLLAKSQLIPWYRWWQSARDIKLILENRRPHLLQHIQKLQQEQNETQSLSMIAHLPNDEERRVDQNCASQVTGSGNQAEATRTNTQEPTRPNVPIKSSPAIGSMVTPATATAPPSSALATTSIPVTTSAPGPASVVAPAPVSMLASGSRTIVPPSVIVEIPEDSLKEEARRLYASIENE